MDVEPQVVDDIYQVVVAIDFGTSRTAASFYLAAKKRTFALVWEGAPQGHSSRKAPTVILYEKKENDKLVAVQIGHDAIAKYNMRGASTDSLVLLKYVILSTTD